MMFLLQKQMMMKKACVSITAGKKYRPDGIIL
jgi:hypothetical protein